MFFYEIMCVSFLQLVIFPGPDWQRRADDNDNNNFWNENKNLMKLFGKIESTLSRPRCVKSPLLWRHNGRDGVSNHQPHDCLLSRLFKHRWKKTSKLRVTGLCVGNSPVTGEFLAQRASNAEDVSIWWRHHENMLIGMCYNAFIWH